MDDERVSAVRTKVAPQLVVASNRDVTTSFGRDTWPPDTPVAVLFLGGLPTTGSTLVDLLPGLQCAAIASALWLANIVFIQLVRVPRLSFSFEHLTRSPARALRRILSGQGGAAADDVMPELVPTLTRTAEIAPPLNHTVAGNPLRLRRTPLGIQEDDKWRSGLSRGDELVILGLTWPLLLAYGYPLSRTPRGHG